MTMNFGPQNPWWEAFNDIENPLGLKTNFLGRFGGGSPFQNKFASSLFEPTFNRFLSQLGQGIMSGQNQSQTFTDFLNQDFNFQREMLRSPDLFSRNRYTGGPLRYIP